MPAEPSCRRRRRIRVSGSKRNIQLATSSILLGLPMSRSHNTQFDARCRLLFSRKNFGSEFESLPLCQIVQPTAHKDDKLRSTGVGNRGSAACALSHRSVSQPQQGSVKSAFSQRVKWECYGGSIPPAPASVPTNYVLVGHLQACDTVLRRRYGCPHPSQASYVTKNPVSRTPDTDDVERRVSLFLLKKLCPW